MADEAWHGVVRCSDRHGQADALGHTAEGSAQSADQEDGAVEGVDADAGVGSAGALGGDLGAQADAAAGVEQAALHVEVERRVGEEDRGAASGHLRDERHGSGP